MNMDERAANWSRRYPVGTQVLLRRDDGTETETHVTSQAWVISGRIVAKFSGVSGAYHVERATKI